MKPALLLLAAAASASLAACATAPRVSPVEVTRFHQAGTLAQMGQGSIFVETAPGQDADAGDIAVFKAAVAAELEQLGYRETPRSEAAQIAQVRIERYVSKPGERRSPVTVGGGGSVGSYGSGVGVGIGINLGGGAREVLATDLGVMIRDAATNNVLWEGRASFSVSDNSEFADSGANASAIADALFSEFPGNNGETVEVRIAK